jgi:hypothetical protein
MADIVTSRQFATGEKNITAQKLNDIIGSSVIQPAFVSAKPVASAVAPADNLLLLTAGGAYNQVPFSTLSSSIIGSTNPNPAIWNVRLRSFNACGNPNFEVDQRNVHNAINTGAGTFICDRWFTNKTGSMVFNGSSQVLGNTPNLVPGTSFALSSAQLRIPVITQQTTLAAGDFWVVQQAVEGPLWRELQSDVHSISLLVQSTVAPLSFSLYLRDVAVTKTLVKLCTIPVANTPTLIQLPNLPVFPSGGNYVNTPGVQGYMIGICLACGTTNIAPAADTWQTGGYLGAPGMSNFAASAVNSVFNVQFVQHEPGAVCSTLMDKSWQQNYDECLRYYCKSYDYTGAVASANFSGACGSFIGCSATVADGSIRFPKAMAKPPPTINIYNPSNGALNSSWDSTAGVAVGLTGTQYVNSAGFFRLAGTVFTAGHVYSVHYAADTGW